MLKPHHFNELTGRSVCSSSFFIPVEAISPPKSNCRLKLKAQSSKLKERGVWKRTVLRLKSK